MRRCLNILLIPSYQKKTIAIQNLKLEIIASSLVISTFTFQIFKQKK